MTFQDFIIITGYSDKELADMLMVSIPTVVRWRSGANEPHILAVEGIVRKVLNALEHTVGDITVDQDRGVVSINVKLDKSIDFIMTNITIGDLETE